EEIGADGARHISGLVGGFLRRPAREVEPVDEFPSKDAHGRGKPIDTRRRDNDAIRCDGFRVRAPDSPFAGVAPNADHAVWAERSDESEDGPVVRREIIGSDENRRLVAEPGEVRCDLASGVLIGHDNERSQVSLRSTGPCGEKPYSRAGYGA